MLLALGAPRPVWMDKGVPYLERGKRDMKEIYKTKKADEKKWESASG